MCIPFEVCKHNRLQEPTKLTETIDKPKRGLTCVVRISKSNPTIHWVEQNNACTLTVKICTSFLLWSNYPRQNIHVL